MKLMFHYGSDAVLLPATVTDHLDKATKKDIRVLFALAAEPLARIDMEAASRMVADRLSMTEAEIEAALAFWRGTGIVTAEQEGEAQQTAAVQSTQAPVKPPMVVADGGLPLYSTEELSGVLERRKELAVLIDECQRIFGKVFNTKEVGVIAGMMDYLGLDSDYILLLLAHCVKMEKKSMRAVEKMAISLHDEGVTEASILEERLRRIEMMAGAIGKIRGMFGATSRALTTKEKRMVEKWICTMQYPHSVIELAYEITVDSIGEASFPYANTILERWYAEGYKTAEDVQRAIAEYRRKKSDGNTSFDVDDFFEAALKRTYGEQ